MACKHVENCITEIVVQPLVSQELFDLNHLCVVANTVVHIACVRDFVDHCIQQLLTYTK